MSEDRSAASLREVAATFGRIGLIGFGGPAGQFALMHRVLVDEKRWIDDEEYLRALNFCTLLPGPEAQQLATYVGWRLQGLAGGLAAGLLFVLPGAAVVLGLSVLYAYAAHLAPVSAALLGVKAAVLAIVLEAMIRLARRALNSTVKRLVAVAALAALAIFDAPFPAVVAAAGLAGAGLAAWRPALLRIAPPSSAAAPGPVRSMLGRTIATILVWALIWAAPLVLLWATLGPDHVLVAIGAFFAKLAAVSFGGAYAALAYMAQEAVATYAWLEPGEMADGLGLAETTPGPLILVTEFVGFLTAFRAPAPFAPLVAGVLGAFVALWMTFAPCFLWIFAGAPFVERLARAPRLQGALAAISAAVVGVIGNLALWFALHVMFRAFRPWRAGPASLDIPEPASLDPWALALGLVSAALLFGLRWGVLRTLGAAVVGGLALHLAGAF